MAERSGGEPGKQLLARTRGQVGNARTTLCTNILRTKKMPDYGNACSGFNSEEIAELRAIAELYRDAGGTIIKLTEKVGGVVEEYLKKLPDGWQKLVENSADHALQAAYAVAATTHASEESDGYLNRALASFSGEGWHKLAAGVSGLVGGAGGLASTLADLATTTTVIMRSIQQIAASHGEVIDNAEVRLCCLEVFGFGGPLAEDDEVETGLFGVRLALRGKTVEAVIRAVLPRFGLVVSEKILAQAAPVLGAVTGAAINTAFTGYYQQMAHVQFRLRKLEKVHDPDQVRACFERVDKAVRDEQRANRRGRK